MKTRLEKLQALRAFYNDKNNWTRGTSFRDKTTQASLADLSLIEVKDRFKKGDVACCFVGAMEMFGLGDNDRKPIREACFSKFNKGAVNVNDDLGFDAVIEVIDAAIAKVSA